MRKLILMIFISLLSSALMAQSNPDIFLKEKEEKKEKPEDPAKTLFGGEASIGGFGALEFKVSELRKDISFLMGAKGGIVLNHGLALGIAGYGFTTSNGFKGTDPVEKLNIYGGYGGLYMEFIIAPSSLVHVSFPLVIGAGGIEVGKRHKHPANPDEDYDWTNIDNFYPMESSTVFVAEPGVNIELNLAKFCRLGIGGSYRYMSGSDLVNVSDSDLRGWAAHFTMKFGKF